MATYVLKRKSYAVVRNPYIERRVIPKSSDENESELLDNSNTPELNKQVKKMRNETPVYQNLDKDKNNIQKVNNIASKANKDKLSKNQNININKTTNINNPSKEKAAELDAQVKMSKMRQQSADGSSVNEKLIEIQKTNPLKPLSMNGRN